MINEARTSVSDTSLGRGAQSQCGQMLNFHECLISLSATKCAQTLASVLLQKIRILYSVLQLLFKNDVCVCVWCEGSQVSQLRLHKDEYYRLASLLLYLTFSFCVMKFKQGARQTAWLLRGLDVQA